MLHVSQSIKYTLGRVMSGSRWLVSIHSLASSSRVTLMLHPLPTHGQPVQAKSLCIWDSNPRHTFASCDNIVFSGYLERRRGGMTPHGGMVTTGLHGRVSFLYWGVLAGLAVWFRATLINMVQEGEKNSTW